MGTFLPAPPHDAVPDAGDVVATILEYFQMGRRPDDCLRDQGLVRDRGIDALTVQDGDMAGAHVDRTQRPDGGRPRFDRACQNEHIG